MPETIFRDPLGKRAMRWAWRSALGLHGLAGACVPLRFDQPRVFYGGARAGSVGGPLVKVTRLQQRFPQHLLGYNLVYALSNTPYLPDLALALLKARRIPLVSNQNGVFYPGWFSGDWRGRNDDMARVYHRANHVFFQSDFCRRAAARFLGERQGAGEILYNAVDINHFSPAAGVAPAAGPFRFLVTGKMDLHVAYRIIGTLRGLARARRYGLDCLLEVAGWADPEAEAAARAEAVALGLEQAVVFSGPYSQADAPTVYRRADAYVSFKHQDACPNAVIEALACGLPVLYAASGGVPELVGEAGIGLDSVEDWEQTRMPEPAEIGDAMLAIAERAATLAPLARQRAVRNFDIEHWYDRHAQVFRSLLEARA